MEFSVPINLNPETSQNQTVRKQKKKVKMKSVLTVPDYLSTWESQQADGMYGCSKISENRTKENHLAKRKVRVENGRNHPNSNAWIPERNS